MAVGLPVSPKLSIFSYKMHCRKILTYNKVINLYISLIPFDLLLNTFSLEKECWWAFRDVEHRNLGSGCIAWTRRGKTGFVMGKMVISGLTSKISISLKRYFWSKKTLQANLLDQVGLKGEAMNLVSPNSVSSAEWTKGSLIAQKQQPLAWHKVQITE